MFNGYRVARVAALTALCGLAALVPASAGDNEVSTRADKAYVDNVCTSFVAIIQAQMEQTAAREHIEVPAQFRDLFGAMSRLDEAACSRIYDAIISGIGQYEGTTPQQELNALLWPFVQEAYGAVEQREYWHPTILREYAETILGSIPDGAIYFGGTCPGRFVITAFHDVTGHPDIDIITQNGLADSLYLAYLRLRSGTRVDLPTEAERTRAFMTYVTRVRTGRIPHTGQIRTSNDQVRISGALAIMGINALIARKIFNDNKAEHPFFVEESFAIDWMYPYMEPHGLIMKLNAQERPLTDEIVTRDRDFWANLEKRLMADPRFLDTPPVERKTYSKLRSGIAGLYAQRGRETDAEEAFRQARRLYTQSAEVPHRLAELLSDPALPISK